MHVRLNCPKEVFPNSVTRVTIDQRSSSHDTETIRMFSFNFAWRRNFGEKTTRKEAIIGSLINDYHIVLNGHHEMRTNQFNKRCNKLNNSYIVTVGLLVSQW